MVDGTLQPAWARTILLVEDDAEMRTMLEILFETKGYHLLIAEDGKAGWDLARAHPGPIDLLLSDIVMPRMTGVELAQRINKTRPETKVLLVSAYHHAILLIDPNWTFLPKPYEPSALVVKIAEMLAEV
ncbi:MAG TPA: response regulator [Candidatus Acidoferrales bacterium]|nr:response regulator [Candidatus Acidoferrales bacterium]